MIRSLGKPRDVNEKLFNEQNVTIGTHVRYKSLYIPLPSSEKQEREMIEFCNTNECTTTFPVNKVFVILNIFLSRLVAG